MRQFSELCLCHSKGQSLCALRSFYVEGSLQTSQSVCPSFLLLCIIKVMSGYTEFSREGKLIFTDRRSISNWVIMICLS